MTKEQKAAYMRQWREDHPDHREYMRNWREANRKKLAEYRHQWYETHKEEERLKGYKWREANPVEWAIHRKVKAANSRYEGRICAQDVRDVIDRDGWFCHWCKKSIETLRDFTLEHLEPVNDPAVLTIACRTCNSARLPRWGLLARLEQKEYLARRAGKKREYDKKWKSENREHNNDLQRARYWAHIDERRAYFREWQRRKRERDKQSG